MANNQYNFLDYAGLSLFWNNVKSIIEENELTTASALTNLDTRVDNVESSKSDKGHTHNYASSPSAGGAANWLKGDYTYAQEQPNYFGMNKVGALMMNTSINGNSQCKDFLIMDCYWGFDVGGAVAFGVNRQSLGAYIMRSEAARETWEESAELLGTHNYTLYTVKKDGTGASGTWGISISGNATTATKATQDGNGNVITSTYLPLSGGIMDSGAGIKWSDRTSSTWDTFGLDVNTGLQILNTVGGSSTNAPSDYSVGLSVSGYYGFCLAYYGGGDIWWLKGNGDEEWKTVIHSGNIGLQSVNYANSAGSAPASDVYSWAKADTKPSYTGTEVTLSGYSKNNSYTPIASGDSVQAAIAKLEGALSGLEDLLASI